MRVFRTEIFGASWPDQLVRVYIFSVLFVVFLPVMYIWVDLQVHEDTKLAAWGACKVSLANISSGRGCLISLLWEWDQDGPLHSSTLDIIAAQICCVKQSSGK
jgi:hypothetical protein